MSRKLDKLLREVLELEQEDRAKLVGHLIESLDPEVDKECRGSVGAGNQSPRGRDRFRCRKDDSLGRGEEATRARLERNLAAAAQFLTNLDIAIGRIRGSPERWPRVFGDYRRFMLPKFPFSVV